MAVVGESSSAPLKTMDEKPVIVRVKRKTSQSPLDAFWLEINERPLKRALLDLESLSISESTGKEVLKTKKVLVQHVETVSSYELTDDIVQSYVETDSSAASESAAKREERRHNFKKENEKRQDQILSKARQAQEDAAKNARFEQIWRRRKRKTEVMHVKLHEMCQFYDVVRVDVEESSSKVQQHEETLEDQKLLSSYLPLLREFIPGAASEIESELHAYSGNQESTDHYVYDIYRVNDEMDTAKADISSPFPLVKVDEDEFYNGPDGSDCETDDSNAEDNPLNDYPDEESSSEEDEGESEASDGESKENESDRCSESDVTKSRGLSHADYFDEDGFDDNNEDFDDSDCDYDHDRDNNDVEHGTGMQIS